MIFLYVGLALLGIVAFIYALIKWIIPNIPFLIKKIKEKRAKKKEQEKEEQSVPSVELATKGAHNLAGSEEVTHSQNYKEVAYLQEDETSQEKIENDKQEQESDKDEEFQQFLKNFKKNNEENIKTQIKTSSPKLKAILMSGALQDKKYID